MTEETTRQWQERHKANPWVQRMVGMDPNYGSQRHQRMFVQRQVWLQHHHRCPTEHEHSSACYSTAALQAAYEACR